ncbi:hypothetical protein CGCF413_v001457 [Colletotrichum fructicola]|nr:hypothetical protein CGCF413_v001457 [Colletotrichum fructicola]
MSLPLGPPRPGNDHRPGLSCSAPESAQLRLAYTHHPHNHRLEPITTSFQEPLCNTNDTQRHAHITRPTGEAGCQEKKKENINIW